MIVNHKGYKSKVVFGSYAYNANTAIILMGAEGTEYEGETIAVATANGTTLPTDIVGIKTWSENKGIDEALIKANVIEPMPVNIEPTGYVNIIQYKLTDEAIKEMEKQNRRN